MRRFGLHGPGDRACDPVFRRRGAVVLQSDADGDGLPGGVGSDPGGPWTNFSGAAGAINASVSVVETEKNELPNHTLPAIGAKPRLSQRVNVRQREEDAQGGSGPRGRDSTASGNPAQRVSPGGRGTTQLERET